MTTIKKILCAIDLTKASRNAFDRALSVARVSRARLYVLHAVPANMPFSWRATERLELLTKLRKRAEREGVPVRMVEQHGDPASVIVLHANSRKADLVVLGFQPATRLAPIQRGLYRRTRAAPRRVGSADCSVGHPRRNAARKELRVNCLSFCVLERSRYAWSIQSLMRKRNHALTRAENECRNDDHAQDDGDR